MVLFDVVKDLLERYSVSVTKETLDVEYLLIEFFILIFGRITMGHYERMNPQSNVQL